MHTATRVAGVLAGLTLSLGTLGSAGSALAAPATQPDSAPCAQQQKQLDKANAALERVTAVFEAKKDKVAKAKHETEAATTAHERNQARRDLAKAKDARDTARTEKKAQQERVEKAQARLDECEADQPATS